MKELWDLFLCFAQVGLFTFGGGYAMLPMLTREVVEHRGWATEEELVNYFAIGQCTPGVIAVNTATFIGYKRRGVIGGIVATLGMVFPSWVIICVIAGLLQNFQDLPVVQHAFAGIRVAVGVLILNAVIRLWKTTVSNRLGLGLAAASFLVSVFLSPSPIWIVLCAGILGVVLPQKYTVKDKDKGAEK